MNNILLLNAHQPSDFARGQLNQSLIDMAQQHLQEKGYNTRYTHTANEYSVTEELDNHQWADGIILQSPVNWMGVPWSFKKYMDEVYTAGMGGIVCNGDGRSEESPEQGYGEGGTMQGKKYMLSLTFNAPKSAFDNPNEYLLRGKSVDDLFFPMHMNYRFFGMEALPTFVCFDVMKNPQIEADFARFQNHLAQHFS